MPQTITIDAPEKALEPTALLFRALSETPRIRILNLLAQSGEVCNCQIEQVTGYGNSKISRHLAFLKNAGLIQDRRNWVWIYYSITPAGSHVHELIHQILDTLPEEHELLRADTEKLKSCCSSDA
ncbi:MAG: metalloregulator ArsR/SmtB family transcription factor [Verrucomicrobia bacterium]|nr:metalloregulator ArsR/SmtB family transcription factor [Verrucomicrobiota bacterium]